MTKGYLFPTISPESEEVSRLEDQGLFRRQMTKALKAYSIAAGEHGEYSMHSFRSGGTISQALAGENLRSIMQRFYFKQLSKVWRYMRLMQVVAPGTSARSMVEGVSEDEFRQ